MARTDRAADRRRWIVDPSQRLIAKPGFDLAQRATDDRPGFERSRKAGVKALAAASSTLADLQDRLYAEGADNRETAPGADGRRRASVLLVLQGMDTAGKGGTVKHVVGAVDPQGVHYTSFKAPTEDELKHDFLWRIRPHVPQPGFISVFDRSHYEDVLIGRVRKLASPDEIERRYLAINAFERELVDSGVRIVKVMLHVGFDEQERRLMSRLEHPKKYWKFNTTDVDERMLWPEYQHAYQIAIARTSTDHAPWFVVPADHKWYARLAVQQLLIETLEELDLGWPPARFDVDAQRERLQHLEVPGMPQDSADPGESA